MFRKKTRLLSLVLAILVGQVAGAQVTTGTISGVVRDDTGGVVPGVTVSVKNIDTGITRTLITDEGGRYRASNLGLGNYEAQAELSGFKAEVRSGITLTVGREAVVDFTLQVGNVTEKVEVTGEAPLVETTSATLSALVDERKIRDLPLNGRDFVQLALLQTGVVQGYTQGQDNFTGFGTKFSVAGARLNQNTFLLDGTDLQTQQGGTPGSVAGGMLGVETMREFSILTNVYSAEYGKVSGGVINAVTRSGTNEFHGTLFEFLRNDNLDARGFFDGRTVPEFRRNQFGAVLSGPIVKNKTFFMGGYEGLREGLGLTNISNVPTALARQGILPTQTVAVSQAVRPYLDLWPLPNGRDFGDGRAEFISSSTRITSENYYTARVDHTLSESDSFFVRYTFDDATRGQPNSLLTTLNALRTRNQVATIGETKIISPRLINTGQFGFTRAFLSNLTTGVLPQLTDPAFAFLPGWPVGTIQIPGIAGPGVSTPVVRAFNTFQGSDTLLYARGRHTFKSGADVKRYRSNQFGSGSGQAFGRWQFDSLTDFLVDNATRFGWDVLGFSSLDPRYFREWLFGFFAQDDVKVKQNLTVNLGLRYEFITVPKEKFGRTTSLVNITDTRATVGPIFKNPSLRSFAPRIGLAWDAFGDGKTAIRAGFGIFYDQFVALHALDESNPPFGASNEVSRPPFPRLPLDVLSNPFGGASTLNIVFFNLKQPTKLRFSLDIQREIHGGTVLNMAYVGAHGYHQIRLIDEHNTAIPQILPDGRKFFPPNPVRRNPAWGNIRVRGTDGDALYHSFQLGLSRRWAQGLAFQAAYTFSKNIDNGILEESGLDFINSTAVVDPDDSSFDRSASVIDIKHNFVLNSSYALPGGNLTGVAGKIVGGWEFSGILKFNSGNPFTALLAFDRARKFERSNAGGQRPDLAPNASNNPVLGSPDRWFDPSGFLLPEAGFLGNLGRNTIIGPGLANLDLSLVKNTALGEGKNLQFRAESFNLTNHPNFQIPSATTIFDARGRVAAAGRITGTKTTSRQLQFGLKFTF